MSSAPPTSKAVAQAPAPVFSSSPVYQMACKQLQTVAGVMDCDPGIIERLSVPKRSLVVSIPIRMDNGETHCFPGYRVQHSLTSGASKGGLRYAPSVDLGEVAALSMWMSWKCGIMNLPFSGAKGGIACDPTKMSRGELERLTRRYTEEVLPIIGPRIDVMAPDLGTDEQTMAWIMDTYSMKVGYACPEIVTGKPIELGGCVGRREATGRGIVFCVIEALSELGLTPGDSTAVVQGFGNVGSVVCQEMVQRGIKVIAIGDRDGAIHNKRGLDINALIKHVHQHRTVKGFKDAEAIAPDSVLTIPCTILAPCAMERVITAENAGKLKCKIIAEGANGPTTPEADLILQDHGIFVIPDVLCNAGGVTVSYFEWVQDLQQYFWDEEQVNAKLKELMQKAYQKVRHLAIRKNLPTRLAALTLGVQKVANEKATRGLFP